MKHIISLGELVIDLIPGSRVQLAETCYTPYPGCATSSDLLTLSKNDLNNLGNFASFVAGLSVTSYGGILSFPFIYQVNDFSTHQEQGKEQASDMQA